MATAIAQLGQVRIRQLDRLLDAERRLREAAEGRAAAARGSLYEIAQGFCSQELDTLLRERKAEVQAWSPEELRDFIFRTLSPRVGAMQAGDRLEAKVEGTLKEVKALRAQIAKKDCEIEEGEVRVRQLEAELRTTRDALREANRHAAEHPATHPGVSEGGISPEPVRVVQSPGPWFDGWRAHKHFARSKDLIRLLGESGASRRSALREKLNEAWGLNSREAMKSATRLSEEAGLMEILTPQGGKQGRPPQLLRLTERGRDVFLLLFSEEAVPSELDELMKRHKSPEHTVLNLEAADMLQERLGATVDLYPSTINLDDGRRCAPDLVATLPDGQVICVECERDTAKNRADRAHKWQNTYDAAGGKIHVICPDPRTRSAIISEINEWSGTRPVQIRATDITTLNRRSDAFWFYQRPRGERLHPAPTGEETGAAQSAQSTG